MTSPLVWLLLNLAGVWLWKYVTISVTVQLRGGIKKTVFFFGKTPKRGGEDLAESKISLSEKTEIFLEFFFQKGGGLTYSKRVLS